MPTSQLNATPYQDVWSFYLQDTFSVTPNLSVALGVRYDNQQVYSGDGTRQINLTGSWGPRIGFTWDPTKDGRSKIFGSFGYFYEQVPMDLVIRSYSSERQPTIYNFDPVSIVPDPDAALIADDQAAFEQGGGKIFGGFNSLTDEGIKGQYLREGLFGVEREICPSFALGARFVYRDMPRVIEDYLCSDAGDYCIGNPTRGRMANLFSLDYATQFPAPAAKRIYKGFQFEATKRFSDNWTLLASYVYSTLQGNYDGLFAPYTQPRGTADPNISALYDYYDFFTGGPVVDGVAQPVTASGYLSNDRRSVAKLSGVYVTPFNLSLGLVTYYQTGLPISRIGFSNAYSRPEFFIDRRGSEGRTQSSYDADIHLGYPLQLGPVTVTVSGGRLQHPQHAARPRGRPAIQPGRVSRSEFQPEDVRLRQQPESGKRRGLQSDVRPGHRPHAADLGALRAEGGVLDRRRRRPQRPGEEVGERRGDGAGPLHRSEVPGAWDRRQARARNRRRHGLGVRRRRQGVFGAHDDERRESRYRKRGPCVGAVAHGGEVRLPRSRASAGA